MMKNIHDIDKFFRDALDEHQETAPPAVWESLNNDLDKKQAAHFREKYYKLKRLALLLLLIIVSGGTYFYFTQSVKKDAPATATNVSLPAIEMNKKKQVPGEITKENTPAESKQYNIKNNPENIPPADKKKIKQTPSNDQYPTDKETAQKTVTHQQNIQDNREAILPAGASTKQIPSSIEIVKQHVRPVNTQQHTGLNPKNELTASTKKIRPGSLTGKDLVAKENTLAGSNQQEDNNQENGVSTEKNDAVKSKKNTYSVNSVNENNNKIAENNTVRSISPYLFQPALSLPAPGAISPPSFMSFYPLSLNDSAKNEKLKTAKAGSGMKANLKNRFSLTAFGSPNHSFRRLENDGKLAGPGRDKNEAQNSEQQGSSFSAGVLVNYGLSKHLIIQSGIVFSSAKTIIAAKTVYARRDNNGHTRFEFNCSSGYSYITPKTSNPPAVGDSMKTMVSSSTITYVGLPISLNYVWQKGKFLFKPGIGFSVNFLTSGNSTTRFRNNTAIQKEATTAITGLKTMYLDGSFGLGVEYMISRKIAVGVRPLMRWALTSINKDTPVRTFQNYISLESGLRINL